jgi:hypothetical protein
LRGGGTPDGGPRRSGAVRESLRDRRVLRSSSAVGLAGHDVPGAAPGQNGARRAAAPPRRTARIDVAKERDMLHALAGPHAPVDRGRGPAPVAIPGIFGGARDFFLLRAYACHMGAAHVTADRTIAESAEAFSSRRPSPTPQGGDSAGVSCLSRHPAHWQPRSRAGGTSARRPLRTAGRARCCCTKPVARAPGRRRSIAPSRNGRPDRQCCVC